LVPRLDGSVRNCATFGTASGSPVAVPGMLKISQCSISSVVFAFDVSGSCRISAKLTVPSGTCVHCNAGETTAGPA